MSSRQSLISYLTVYEAYNSGNGENELFMDEIYGKDNTITYIGHDMLVEEITFDLDEIYRKK